MSLKKYIQEHKSEFDDQVVSSKADAAFLAELNKRHGKQTRGKVIYLRYLSVAACFALVMAAALWFQNTGNKNSEGKRQLMANLIDDSTGTRLEAVYEFEEEYKKEDEQIIDTLTKILLTDKNANVKIAVIDALLKFPKNEKIRKCFIEAMENETQPLVQIKLINTVSVLREYRAKKTLEKIIDNKETFTIVKNNATMAMNKLKQ